MINSVLFKFKKFNKNPRGHLIPLKKLYVTGKERKFYLYTMSHERAIISWSCNKIWPGQDTVSPAGGQEVKREGEPGVWLYNSVALVINDSLPK